MVLEEMDVARVNPYTGLARVSPQCTRAGLHPTGQRRSTIFGGDPSSASFPVDDANHDRK